MRHTILAAAAVLFLSAAAYATATSGYSLNVLIDDTARAEYNHAGSVYIEAIRGREFSIRLTNPTPYRVAVALSVDGLNTIDAKHTDAWSASKWVLDPYESTVITGWQVSDRAARRFYFTGERHSYGAALGQTQNLGVIEAVFYAERQRPIVRENSQPYSGGGRKEQASRDGAASMAPAPSTAKSAPALSDEYAATGMGNRTDHEVERVHLDLDPHPVASTRIRYEFRNELVKLGVLPNQPPIIDRRERARGFEGYCPQP